MKTNRATLLLLSLTLSSAMLASAAQAHSETGTAADDGRLAPNSAATKVIDVSNGKAVNVNEGDIVKFVNNGESFTFNVRTYQNVTHFNLAQVQPKGEHFPSIEVYVEPNPIDVN